MTLFTGACGYCVIRAEAPYGQHTMAVLPFMEVGANDMSAPLTQALSRRLAAGGVVITSDRGKADAILSGHVHVKDVSSTSMRLVQMYTVIAYVHAELNTTAGQALWTHDITLSDDFLPTDANAGVQPLVTEARRRTTLMRLSEQGAQMLQQALAWSSSTEPRAFNRTPTPNNAAAPSPSP